MSEYEPAYTKMDPVEDEPHDTPPDQESPEDAPVPDEAEVPVPDTAPVAMAEPGIYTWSQEQTQHPLLGVLTPGLDCDFSLVTDPSSLQAIQYYLEVGYMKKVR
jgi:hypothetical protein